MQIVLAVDGLATCLAFDNLSLKFTYLTAKNKTLIRVLSQVIVLA